MRAPAAGRVLQVNIRAGEYAEAIGQAAAADADRATTTAMYLRVDIDEGDAWRRARARAARASCAATRALRSPCVSNTRSLVAPKTALSGQGTERPDVRVLQVVYSFARGACRCMPRAADGRLHPGGTGQVQATGTLMLRIALKMLVADRAKFIGLLFGIAFTSFLVTFAASYFCGFMTAAALRWFGKRRSRRLGDGPCGRVCRADDQPAKQRPCAGPQRDGRGVCSAVGLGSGQVRLPNGRFQPSR